MTPTRAAEAAFENRRQRRLRDTRMRFVNEERRGMGWIWIAVVVMGIAWVWR